MLVFPNCKINLGLSIINKRPDGFHNIETVFYPVTWCDALEVISLPGAQEPFTLTGSGTTINGRTEDNLIYKAWQELSKTTSIPPIKVHLFKNLPMGAGLGGGSADAAFFINLLNSKFSLDISLAKREAIAAKLGSDCSFFIKNKAIFAKGKGDEFSDIKTDLSNFYILIVFPGINSNTRDAYNSIKPKVPEKDLRNIIEGSPLSEWKNNLINDFEEAVFIKYPQVKKLKADLYASGAIYASMSGSGSSVFGIFSKKPQIELSKDYRFYLQTPASKIL